MSLIPPGVVTDIATIIKDSATDTATVTRTGASTSVRIVADTDKRGVHLDGMPGGVIHLQRWDLVFPLTDLSGVATNIKIGDVINVTGKGYYTIIMVQSPTSIYPAFFAHAIEIGTAIAAHTLRQPSAMTGVAATAAYATYIPTLNIRPLAGFTWLPSGGTYTTDAFGVQVTAPYTCYADWPTGNTDIQPVLPNDIIVMPDSSQYVVASAEGWNGWRLAITVEMDVV